MPRLSHKQKVKIARRLCTPRDIKMRVPIFQTFGWNARRFNILKRIEKKEGKKIPALNMATLLRGK